VLFATKYLIELHGRLRWRRISEASRMMRLRSFIVALGICRIVSLLSHQAIRSRFNIRLSFTVAPLLLVPLSNLRV
jgi:hypothetical protein